MPQTPIQPIASQIARLPLAKFSHTTTSINHGGPLSWVHVNGRGSLVCVLEKFDGSTSRPSRLILRVTNNRGVLEQLDLEHFVRMAAAQTRAAPNTSSAKPPFVVVVKSPCLAVKYAQNETHVRRFQIKFSQDRDYYTALALLSEINCPLTEGNTPPVHPLQRLSSSSSWASGPSAQLSTTATTNVNPNPAMTPASNSTVPFYPVAGHKSDMMTTSRPPSSASSIIHPLVSGPGQSSSSLQNTVPPLGVNHLQQTTSGPLSRTESMTSQRTEARLATVAAYHDEQQLNEMLPPKRELPFTKSSHGKSGVKNPNQTSREQLNPQILSSGNTSVAPQMSHAATEHKAPEAQEMFIPDSQQSQPLTQTQPPAQESQLSPMSSQLQPLPYPGMGSNEADQQLADPAESNLPVEPHRNGRSDNNRNEQTQPLPSRPERVSEAEQLASYVSAPTAERIAFLENWMCELIEDDKFMTLCQDVEATWRRFAFGMRR